jgi:hypothetical protein
MPPILARVGAERAAVLRRRVLDELTTTFATQFTRHISLADMLDREVMLGYCRQATGEKYLVTPQA